MAVQKKRKGQTDPSVSAFEQLKIYNMTMATVDRTPQGIRRWRSSLRSAENPTNPQRKPLLDLYREIILDPHLSAAMNKRITNVIDNTIKFFDASGKENEAVYKIIQQPFFRQMCIHVLEKIPYGHSLIYFDHISPEGGSRCRLIPRENVKPELGIVVEHYSNTEGTSYIEAPNCNYVISVGDPRDLGLLCKAAPYVLYKKDDLSDWSTYTQIFGIPFRWAEYDGYDENVRKKLDEMLSRSLTAPYATLPKGTNLHIVESQGKSGSSDLFKSLGDFANKEISKLFLGNTMTLDAEGGNYKGEVHEQSELRIASTDKHLLLSILNTEFIRILETFGIHAEGGYFAFDEAEDINMMARLQMDMQLATMIDIPEDYWYETYNIPKPEGLKTKVAKKKEEDPDPEDDPEPSGKKPKEAKLSESRWGKFKKAFSDFFLSALNGKGLEEKVDELYSRFSCSECAGDIKFAETGTFNDSLIITAFSGDMDAAKKIIFERNYSRLSGCVDEVFGDLKFGDPDYLFAEQLRNSTAAFSSYKTMHQIQILEQNRYDSAGNLIKYDDYKARVSRQLRAYNERYLNTEQQAAITRTRIAKQWRDMSANTVMVNVRWLPSRAAHPREAHMPYYNRVWSMSDPFWGMNSPGTLWGCMCGMEPTDDPPSDGKVDRIPASPGLDNNPGVSGELFTRTHPYFKGLGRTLEKQAKRLELNNSWITTAGDGGYAVRTSRGHNKVETKPNRALAERLTAIDKGNIDLLGVEHSGISYDAFRHGRNQHWEFKTPTGGNIKNAIQNELKGAKKDRFLFALSPLHKIEDIYDALSATFIANKRAAAVLEIEFLFPDNFLLHLTAEDLRTWRTLEKAIERQMAAR